MAEIRHLNNAPITEAVLDFRVRPHAHLQFPSDRLDQLAQELSDRYPEVEKKHVREVELQMNRAGATSRMQERGVQAHWFYSSDRKRVAQFRIDGFTYNMLNPYTNWEEMQDEAFRLWKEYEEVLKPEQIVRVATRFINHVTIPSLDDLADYLSGMPFGITNLPGKTVRFLDQVSLVGEYGNSARVVVASENAPDSTITIIADIDVFREQEVQVPVNRNRLNVSLERLRSFKNDIFFSIFTEKALKPYE